MNKLLALLLALVAIACNSCANQPSPAPVPAWDGGPPAPTFDAAPPPDPIPGDSCGAAATNAMARGCILPTAIQGTPWSTVCRAYMAGGVDMHADCVAKATDCDTVTACLSH